MDQIKLATLGFQSILISFEALSVIPLAGCFLTAHKVGGITANFNKNILFILLFYCSLNLASMDISLNNVICNYKNIKNT